jgi:hypothetical protein
VKIVEMIVFLGVICSLFLYVRAVTNLYLLQQVTACLDMPLVFDQFVELVASTVLFWMIWTLGALFALVMNVWMLRGEGHE